MPSPLTTPIEPPLHIDALQRSLQAGAPQQAVQRIETHISWVLLCGSLAYKIKKPVRLGFVDFSTAAARRHACEEELRLNRRLAPSLYLDVVAVRGTPEAPHIGGDGPLIDHAVRMRRFAADGLFSERLAQGILSTAELDGLARRIADFHRQAPAAPAGSDFGTPAVIEGVLANVLAGLEPHAAPGALDALRGWLDAQAVALRPRWSARRAAGWVRECHGDLHLANATLVDGQAVAFDGIEFDPALRWIDVMSDVAFMVMDLVAHGRRDLGFRFLDTWLERTGDHDGLAVLRWYMVYRALVRALVGTLQSSAPGGPDYLAVARALAGPGDPRLLITHGLSGSGKTFVSGLLLERAGAIRLRSDVERKRLFGLEALQSSSSDQRDVLYGADATERTFARLRECADVALRAGYPTIVDAAFLRRRERASFAALAAAIRVPFTILHCRAPDDELRRRVATRQAGGQDASEADLAVLQRQADFAEPPGPDERDAVIEVDSAAGVDAARLCDHWLASPARAADGP
jgi:aminoglycoside phosphotransferase family enzyme/predicted kinase